MLAHILRNTEWKQLTAFVSPAFFDVLPPRKLYRRSRALLSSRDAPLYREAVATRQASLRALPLAVGVHELPSQRDALPEAAHAERIVTLYFHQLFGAGATLLDLRDAALRDAGSGLQWAPSAWVAEWDATFISALRDVYLGFYRDGDAVFRAGLTRLGIAACEDLFREHFGSNQQAHQFRTKEFVDTFHKVFVRCRDEGIELHADFLPLGIYLACLHDALDARGQPVDVRSCFERALSAQQPSARAASR